MSVFCEALERQLSFPLVLSDSASLSREDAYKSVRSLATEFVQNDVRRLLLISDDPYAVIVALVASQEHGVDLFLAPKIHEKSILYRIQDGLEIGHILKSVSPVSLSKYGNHLSDNLPQGGRIFLITSGTTGTPKVIEHTPKALLGRVLSTSNHSLIRNSRWLMTYLSTTFAGLQVILTALFSGGTLVVPSRRTAQGFAEAATHHDVTHVSGTPTFWRSFLMACNSDNLPKVQQITLGGEACDQSILDRLTQVFPDARICHIYASSEAGAVFAVNDGRSGFPAHWLDEGIGGVKLRIRDNCLQIHTPRRMVGYAHETPDSQSESDWIATNDLVRVEGDRVEFLGRRDDIVNIGGSNVYPQEVEAFVLSIPAVQDVKVFGVSNPLTGQVLQADIVVRKNEDSERVRLMVMRHCRDGLVDAKIPRIVRTVDTIPVHQSGKKA